MSTERRLSPIHPGKILNEEFLVPMQVSQYRLAKEMGVDATRIHSIVKGKRAITAETALLLGRFFGNSPGFWMGLQSQYDLEVAQDRLSESYPIGTETDRSGWVQAG
ncbi:MAG: HigA family addiction module antidote protein [Acidimicrobiia bacterium]|nr:HigA family addiction module antidote protein [Acidimicrobiia bacterium]MYD05053.1 HigA family addiction module antidote protein [Acidimicrobiia bacterium]MYF26426.1 HigA family addiction module antidote protein [Acidimicrobiia bacterium]MYH56207.1 HigA family addiction module antidote protein [Acidimicrobiia bacterium]